MASPVGPDPVTQAFLQAQTARALDQKTARALYQKGYKFDEHGIRAGNPIAQLLRMLSRYISGEPSQQDIETGIAGQLHLIVNQLSTTVNLADRQTFFENLRDLSFRDNPEGLKELNLLIDLLNQHQKEWATSNPFVDFPAVMAQLRDSLNAVKRRSTSEFTTDKPVQVTNYTAQLNKAVNRSVSTVYLIDVTVDGATLKLTNQLVQKDFHRSKYMVNGRVMSSVEEMVRTLRQAGWSNSQITHRLNQCDQGSLILARQQVVEDLVKQNKAFLVTDQPSYLSTYNINTSLNQIEMHNSLQLQTVTDEGDKIILSMLSAHVVLKPDTDSAEISYGEDARINVEDYPEINPISSNYQTLTVNGQDFNIPKRVIQSFNNGDRFFVETSEYFKDSTNPNNNTLEKLISYCLQMGMTQRDIEKSLEVCHRGNTETVHDLIEANRNQTGFRSVDFSSASKEPHHFYISRQTGTVWLQYPQGIERAPSGSPLNRIDGGMRVDINRRTATVQYFPS